MELIGAYIWVKGNKSICRLKNKVGINDSFTLTLFLRSPHIHTCTLPLPVQLQPSYTNKDICQLRKRRQNTHTVPVNRIAPCLCIWVHVGRYTSMYTHMHIIDPWHPTRSAYVINIYLFICIMQVYVYIIYTYFTYMCTRTLSYTWQNTHKYWMRWPDWQSVWAGLITSPALSTCCVPDQVQGFDAHLYKPSHFGTMVLVRPLFPKVIYLLHQILPGNAPLHDHSKGNHP